MATIPANAPCCACREALHTWVLSSNGLPYCDACFWEVTAPYGVKRGTLEYDMTKTKGIEMTSVEWEVYDKATGEVVGSRKQLSAAHSLAGMMNSNSGHTVEVEYSE